MQKHEFKIKSCAYDETEYYDKDFLKEHGIKQMLGVYLIDTNLQIHVCSFTPSYEALFVENVPVFEDHVSDDVKERALDALMLVAADTESWTYFNHLPELQADEPLNGHALDLLEDIYADGKNPLDTNLRADIMEEVRQKYVTAPSW